MVLDDKMSIAVKVNPIASALQADDVGNAAIEMVGGIFKETGPGEIQCRLRRAFRQVQIPDPVSQLSHHHSRHGKGGSGGIFGEGLRIGMRGKDGLDGNIAGDALRDSRPIQENPFRK
jgi:hypothetical protein